MQDYNPYSLGAAPLVAAALGRSLGVKVIVDGSQPTAMTDGKTIVLPRLPVSVSEDTAKLLWGFIHHEAAHCRHTDFTVGQRNQHHLQDKLVGYLTNVLEDIRIERAQAFLYPGCVSVLADLEEVLVSNGFYSVITDDSSPLEAFSSFVLMHLRHTVLKQSATESFAKASRSALEVNFGKGFVTRLTAELQPILAATSTQDAVDLAIRLRDFIETEQENEQNQQNEQNEQNEQKDEGSSPTPDSNDGNDNSDDLSDDSNPVAESDTRNSQLDDSDSSSDSTEDQHGSEQSDSSNRDSGEESSNMQTIDALQQLIEADDLDPDSGDLGHGLSKLLEDEVDSQPGTPLVLPTDDVRVKGGRDPSMVSTARRGTAKLAVQLKRMLESENLVISDPSRRGKRISRRHLTRVKQGDYRVMVTRTYERETNTAFVFLVDVSSSMRGEEIELASRSALATSLALTPIAHLAHAIGAFPSVNGAAQVELVKDFHETTEMIGTRFRLTARGMTPLAEALLWATDRLAIRPEPRKVICVATDGEPNDVTSTKQVLSHIKRLGIESHCLGINTPDTNLFDSFAQVNSVDELARVYLKLFQRLLRKTA